MNHLAYSLDYITNTHVGSLDITSCPGCNLDIPICMNPDHDACFIYKHFDDHLNDHTPDERQLIQEEMRREEEWKFIVPLTSIQGSGKCFE
jgi:hypothetical protein